MFVKKNKNLHRRQFLKYVKKFERLFKIKKVKIIS